ncbi:MAG: radical SAM protein [Syntrophaceae bacterium]
MTGRQKESDPSLLSKEEGAVRTPWHDRLRICLAYPSPYRTGMSNLGFQTLYALFNGTPSFLCERVFLPDPGDEASFSPGSTPLVSLESGRPLHHFDIVAFSVSFENDYPNILKMLEMGRIPLLAEARKEGDPLVIGGGISLILNPEPLARFFDLFLLGEAEEMVPEFLERYRVLRAGGMSRDGILAGLQRGIEGAYAPKFYRVDYGPGQRIVSFRPVDPTCPTTIRVRHVEDINAFRTHQVITTPHTEFSDMFLAEVSRGCFRGCRFCPAGFVYRPARFRKPSVLAASLEEGLRRKGRVGLLGTAVSDHPQLADICRKVLGAKGDFSIGSLRIDRISADLAGLLADSGVEMVSLAPEAGSQRLRDVIRKGVSEEQIFRAAEHLIENGVVNLRLYFMVGLPTERDEDIDAIVDLTRRIGHHAVKTSKGTRRFRRITLSVNQFIPKPATPFQWLPLADVAAVRKKIQKIKRAFGKERSVSVIHDLPKWNYVQALLSLGDRLVGEILLAVHANGGNWPQALKGVNVNADYYVYREKDPSEFLPWDFIDHGVSREFLLEEYRKAMETAKGWT